jgi:hypothetical protein
LNQYDGSYLNLHSYTIGGILLAVGKLAALFVIAVFVTILMTLLVGSVLLVLRLVRDHDDARRYRALLREAERLKVKKPAAAAPTGPAYRMVYKDGKATKEVTLPGSTEAEALAHAARIKLSWSSITTLDKVS